MSIACGERVLFPEVRNAGKESLIVADGFSCREQIRQATDRRGLHLAQVLKMAIDEGGRGPIGNYPERRYITPEPGLPSGRMVLFSIAVGAAAAGMVLASVSRWFKSHR